MSEDIREEVEEGEDARALRARLYQLTHRGIPGDVEHYLRACRPFVAGFGAPERAEEAAVLELGSGSGRLLLALAEGGVAAIGLELDPALRALAEASLTASSEGARALLLEADMRAFDLGRSFDRILAPYNALYCLPTREEQLACLRGVRAHLKEGGLFYFDAYLADAFHEGADPEDPEAEGFEQVATVIHDGRLYLVEERSLWDRPAQRIEATYRYLPADGEGEPITYTIPQRYILSEELPELLEEAGLRLGGMDGGFEGQGFDPELSGWMVGVAERA